MSLQQIRESFQIGDEVQVRVRGYAGGAHRMKLGSIIDKEGGLAVVRFDKGTQKIPWGRLMRVPQAQARPPQNDTGRQETVLRAVPVAFEEAARMRESAVHVRSVSTCEGCGETMYGGGALCGACELLGDDEEVIEAPPPPPPPAPPPQPQPTAATPAGAPADFTAWLEMGTTLESGMRAQEKALRAEAQALADRAAALMDESDAKIKEADNLAKHIEMLARLRS